VTHISHGLAFLLGSRNIWFGMEGRSERALSAPGEAQTKPGGVHCSTRSPGAMSPTACPLRHAEWFLLVQILQTQHNVSEFSTDNPSAMLLVNDRQTGTPNLHKR